MKNTISIEHNNGIAMVPLKNSDRKVALDDADLDALMAAGVPLSWKLSLDGKVRFGSNNETVARLISGAGKGQRVKYLDGNPLNLRRANLVIAHASYFLSPHIEHSYSDKTSIAKAAGADAHNVP